METSFKSLNLKILIFIMFYLRRALMEELKLNLEKLIKYYSNLEPSEGRGEIYKINRYKKNFKLIMKAIMLTLCQ